ncbi:MAG TPA: hypothetical protein VFL94_03115 [Actinomycetales bacterium]|nr:hypothetical protein [Actinomycetales bacterium]
MTSDLRDPLGHALDELRGDVVHAQLPAPHEIRARGDRRARRQRAARGAGAVVAVAAIAVGSATLPGALSGGPGHRVPPAGKTPSVTATTPTPAPSSRDRSVVDVTPVGVGDVPRAYFLPGTQWTGPDLAHGQQIRSTQVKEFEGSVQRFQCDPDAELSGDVAFVQLARADGTMAGTQKVRLLSDPTVATRFTDTTVDAILRCTERLREQAKQAAGELAPGDTVPTPTAEVTEDTAARMDDGTGSVRLFRTVTDYGTGAGSRLIEWVAVAREGSAVTFISLNQFQKGDVSFDALRRIATEARQQMAWAATQQ